MNTYRQGLQNAARNAICDVLGNIANLNDFAQQLPFGSSAPGAALPRELYRLLCDREPPPLPDPPFYGGQCEGVLYKWTYTIFRKTVSTGFESNEGTTSISNIRGRVQDVGLEDTGTSVVYYAIGTNADGSPQRINGFGSGTWSPGTYSWRWEGTITRQDAQPDTCGDPPPIIPTPEPDYRDIDIDFTYNDNSSGSPIDVNIPITFNYPTVNFDGDVIIPIDFNFGDVKPTFRGELNINFSPEINFNFGNPNYAPQPLPRPDNFQPEPDTPEPPPDVPIPVPPPPPDEPEPVPTSVIRAVIVTVSDVPENVGRIFQDINPDILLPNAGFVSFLIAVGNRTAWTSDIPVKNRRNFIECPWIGGAIDVRGTPREGYSWRLSKVFALPDQAIQEDS